MSNRPALVGVLVLGGLVLLALAVLYFVDTAASLPSFIPGHEAGSSHHHVKHGIAALCLALGAFVLAWFATGPRRSATPVQPS